MSTDLGNINSSKTRTEQLLELFYVTMHPNPLNMPFINFESIKDPEYVKKIAIEARKEVMKKINLKKQEKN